MITWRGADNRLFTPRRRVHLPVLAALLVGCLGRGAEARTLRGEHSARVTAIAFSRDGRQFASTSLDGRTVIWDARTQNALVRFKQKGSREQFQEHGFTFKAAHHLSSALAFSPDGRHLASGGAGREVILRRTADGKQERALQIPEAPRTMIHSVAGLKFTANGTRLEVRHRFYHPAMDVTRDRRGRRHLDVYDDEESLVFNLRNGKLTSRSKREPKELTPGPVSAVSRDGRLRVTGGADGTLTVRRR